MKLKFSSILKLITATLLILLNTAIWINGLLIHRERGLDIIWALPLLYAGTFLLSGWYKESRGIQTTKSQRWKFILSAILMNYLVLYFIYAIADIIYLPATDLLSIPGIIFPLLLGIFLTGFVLSWKQELYAGILFVLWYLLVLFGQLYYIEILAMGPYILIGITILVQGILYLYYHFKIKY